MTNKDIEKKKSKKSIIIRAFFLVIDLLIVIFLYNLFNEFGVNPFVIGLILIFVFLLFAGPLLGGKRKSLYSKIFPDKKAKAREKFQRKREEYEIKDKIKQLKLQHLNQISLDSEYRKPIIRKCEKCGMIIPKFAKKCPICGREF